MSLGCGEAEDSSVIAADEACGESLGYVPTWSGWGEGFFTTWCQSCHASSSPNRYGAPESVTFDTIEEVTAQRSAIERSVLTQQTMPPAGGLTDSQQLTLEAFLCSL